jgi:ring-1,2-phenylacetyl-CoA epoxidase subunit PaaC
MENLITYALRIADNSLILSHRLSEYCSHGPYLEEDLAITNVGLDHLGLAESVLDYVGTLDSKGRSADDFAFKRAENEYLNCQLVEQPNTDFAYIMVRQFFMDVFNKLYFTELLNSKNEFFTGLAEKSLKEIRYHERRSTEWIMRLGLGTEESSARVQKALEDLWLYTDELFDMDAVDTDMSSSGIGCDLKKIQTAWTAKVEGILSESNLVKPEFDFLVTEGKKGLHSEHMGHLLGDMQYLNNKYPTATW